MSSPCNTASSVESHRINWLPTKKRGALDYLEYLFQPWISFKSLSLASSLSMTCNRSVFSQSLTPRQQEHHLCTCLLGEWWLIAACFPGTRRSRETARRKCWRGSASPSRPTGASAERATRRPENSPPRARKNRKQSLRRIQFFSAF